MVNSPAGICLRIGPTPEARRQDPAAEAPTPIAEPLVRDVASLSDIRPVATVWITI